MKWYDWLNPGIWLIIAGEAFLRLVESMGKKK